MQIRSLGVSTDTSGSHDQTLIDDLLFLGAWKKALVPSPIDAHVVRRVRRIRRASPAISDGYHAQHDLCE